VDLNLSESELAFRAEAREIYARRLLIRVDAGTAANGFTHRLAETLDPFREGRCPVCIDYTNSSARAELILGREWWVRPTQELLQRLEALAGRGCIQVLYQD
jgi:DNA polymerase-3 subunit alpha